MQNNFPRQTPGQPDIVKPGGSPVPQRSNDPYSLGIGPENFESVFLRHAHDGTIAGGAPLYGPYFIKDSLGKPWKLVVSTSGVLSTVKAF